MDNTEAVFTRHERWALKRAVRKCRNVLRREQTLNSVMRIVINEPALEKVPEQPQAIRYGLQPGIQGAGMSLGQYPQMMGQQIAAQGYYTDARSLYNGTRL
jgi:hypothetical protein